MLICRAIINRAIKAPESRHAMFRLRANAARASLWLDTIPKATRLFFPKFHLQSHRQDGYIEVVETGSQIWIAGTDEKERIEKILGQELVGWNIFYWRKPFIFARALCPMIFYFREWAIPSRPSLTLSSNLLAGISASSRARCARFLSIPARDAGREIGFSENQISLALGPIPQPIF
jgi:hypothetical protein